MAVVVLILWGAAAVSSLILIIAGIIKRKFRFWYLVGFVPFLAGYTFETGIRKYKHEKAVKLNAQIENYRMEHGKYPAQLTDMKTGIELSGLVYSTNGDLTSYRIEYLMDQFNREYFESKSKSWGTLGWND